MKQGRGLFWIIWAVALVPVIIATTAFYSGWRPSEQINHGELFEAGVRLDQLGLSETDAAPGHWQLILLQGAPCSQQCSNWQQMMPNLHASLGRERHRLVWQKQDAGHLDEGLILVDPLGFMVIRYGLDRTPQVVLKDLKRLMKISKVG